MDRKGALISFEGIDGAGKTTLVEMLREELEKQGNDVVKLREPTRGKYGSKIYELAKQGTLTPENELELFILDRKEDVEQNILPALGSGKVVIMDRYYHSNMAYQAARGLDMNMIKDVNERFSPVPDLIIVMDIDPEVSLRRVDERKKVVDVVEHFENERFLKAVREKFLEISKYPNAVSVDASLPAEEVKENILSEVRHRLPWLFS